MRRLCVWLTIIMAVTALATAAVVSPAAATVDLDTVVDALAESPLFIEDGALAGDEIRLAAALDLAARNDINAYTVVLADDTSGVSAADIQARLGKSTVMLFTPSIYDFESSDLCRERFDEARANADGPITTANPDAAVEAFVNELLLLADGDCNADGSTRSSGFPLGTWLLILLALLALGVFAWMLFRTISTSRHAERETVEFEERRRLLSDWAKELRGPVTELQAPVAAAKSSSLASMYNDALKVARESDGDIRKATQLPDLDRVEIRVARAVMQIRDLQKALQR